MSTPRLMQSLRYLVRAVRCLDPRSRIRSARHRHASHSEAELLAKVDEYNQAAERQWQSIANDPAGRAHVLGKPFSTVRDTAAIFSHIGLALEALDVGLGHTVLDFGAGSCWLSAILNRLGARTISIDVSPTALALGEQVFRSDPRQRPELEPRFVPYDGHRLPLADGSVDRAVCFDAFHHVPNQDEALRELYRVLKPGGRLVLAEPGEGHASTGHSRFDAETYGVLENDLHLDELLARARTAGFDGALAKPYPDPRAITLDADAYLRLIEGDHSVYPMHILEEHLRVSHVVILLKGAPRKDSRNPGALRARITPLNGAPVDGAAGKVAELEVRVENLGDTTWLATLDPVGGYVNLGGHLLDADGRSLQRGFFAQALPHDVAPGERVEFVARFHLPERLGRYRLSLDLVDEKVAWFEQCGSEVAECELLVSGWPDSRSPHRLQARIEVTAGRPTAPVAPGAPLPLRLRVANTGDTRWVTDPAVAQGLVRVGVQVLAADGSLLQRDYFRAPLPGPLDPGGLVELELAVPAPAETGRFVLALDMVAELVCWFQQHGSEPARIEVETRG
jgi:SAM-dependent methyltransferase